MVQRSPLSCGLGNSRVAKDDSKCRKVKQKWAWLDYFPCKGEEGVGHCDSVGEGT